MKQKTNKLIIKTTENHVVENHGLIAGYDYITITGARTKPWTTPWPLDEPSYYAPWKGHLLRASYGNQYHFVNQSIRQLQLFPPPDLTNYRIQRIHIIFSQGYTRDDRKRINEYTQFHDARIKYVRNVDELITFLNARVEKKRLIKALTIYSHGIIDNFTFLYGYGVIQDEKPGLLSKDNCTQILEQIFDYDAVVSSYACRTGISIDGKDFSAQGGEAGQENSLAQKMADTWLVDVKAFERRSNYELTYGTSEERATASNYGSVIDEYEKKQDQYEIDLASGKDAKEPEKPADYDLWVRRKEEKELREDNQSFIWDSGPIMQYGAWHGVKAGDTPLGLKDSMQTYTPKDYQ